MTVIETAAVGAKVEIGNGASPEVFGEIETIHNGPEGLGWIPRTIEALSHSAPVVKRKVSVRDLEPITFSIYFDSTDANHLALQTAAKAGAVKNFKVTLTDTGAQVMAFAGVVSRFSFSADIEGWNEVSVEISPFSDFTIT